MNSEASPSCGVLISWRSLRWLRMGELRTIRSAEVGTGSEDIALATDTGFQ